MTEMKLSSIAGRDKNRWLPGSRAYALRWDCQNSRRPLSPVVLRKVPSLDKFCDARRLRIVQPRQFYESKVL